jgi:hypothetical protein
MSVVVFARVIKHPAAAFLELSWLQALLSEQARVLAGAFSTDREVQIAAEIDSNVYIAPQQW